MTKSPQPLPYESPKLVELGTVHELTQTCEKIFGNSDGFTMNGQGLYTTSCTS
jgi:hypothetical protein